MKKYFYLIYVMFLLGCYLKRTTLIRQQTISLQTVKPCLSLKLSRNSRGTLVTLAVLHNKIAEVLMLYYFIEQFVYDQTNAIRTSLILCELLHMQAIYFTQESVFSHQRLSINQRARHLQVFHYLSHAA